MRRAGARRATSYLAVVTIDKMPPPWYAARRRRGAYDTRLRLLHALAREGEPGVTALARAVGMKPQAVSNQLQRLADRGILDSRRNGNGILYRIVDPCVVDLLDRGWCLLTDSSKRPNR